jgi:hypothetical protein
MAGFAEVATAPLSSGTGMGGTPVGVLTGSDGLSSLPNMIVGAAVQFVFAQSLYFGFLFG